MNLTTLEFHRQIPAAPEEVYDVWIDPSHPGGPWFGPNDEHRKSRLIFDGKVDGLFYHSVSAAGQTWTHYGRFTKLERGKVAEHTWVCEATKGRESVVTTTFEARDGGTYVQITHSGVPDDEEGRAQKAGWQWMLGALAEGMAKRNAK
jgi:uncharacterized protein YndB with AHSA1/START domain